MTCLGAAGEWYWLILASHFVCVVVLQLQTTWRKLVLLFFLSSCKLYRWWCLPLRLTKVVLTFLYYFWKGILNIQCKREWYCWVFVFLFCFGFFPSLLAALWLHRAVVTSSHFHPDINASFCFDSATNSPPYKNTDLIVPHDIFFICSILFVCFVCFAALSSLAVGLVTARLNCREISFLTSLSKWQLFLFCFFVFFVLFCKYDGWVK